MPVLKMQTVYEGSHWQCLAASFAIVLDVKLHYIIKAIGHDGGEIIRPELPEPECRRGFHVQECISYAWARGYSTTPFDANPQLVTYRSQDKPVRINFPIGNSNRMLALLQGYNSVLTGQMVNNGRFHAVAWDCEQQRFLNPTSGKIQEITDFAIATAWVLDRRNLD